MESFYVKYKIGEDQCMADVISYDSITNTGTANYYKEGELYALLQRFVLNPTDVKVDKEEFEKFKK